MFSGFSQSISRPGESSGGLLEVSDSGKSKSRLFLGDLYDVIVDWDSKNNHNFYIILSRFLERQHVLSRSNENNKNLKSAPNKNLYTKSSCRKYIKHDFKLCTQLIPQNQKQYSTRKVLFLQNHCTPRLNESRNKLYRIDLDRKNNAHTQKMTDI